MPRSTSSQPLLFDAFPGNDIRRPPTTRYQGSKFKLLPWLKTVFQEIPFHTALDVFGGTGSVAYLLKALGKQVTYNDYLRFNWLTGVALIDNSSVTLPLDKIDWLFQALPGVAYDGFIARTFRDIYFTPEEDRWLDLVSQNIPLISDKYERALAYFALFQSCIIKRPYNLFHRKNLYMRTADVDRGFGNKATWDTPFDRHFRNFLAEANAAVFDSGIACSAVQWDARAVPGHYELVYVDPPYITCRGVGVDYLDFYHFLEGLTDYQGWAAAIDSRRKHHPLQRRPSPWSSPKTTHGAFEELFQRYRDSTIVVSYRSDGIPSEQELTRMLKKVKNKVETVHYGDYKYVLSTNESSREIILIGS